MGVPAVAAAGATGGAEIGVENPAVVTGGSSVITSRRIGSGRSFPVVARGCADDGAATGPVRAAVALTTVIGSEAAAGI